MTRKIATRASRLEKKARIRTTRAGTAAITRRSRPGNKRTTARVCTFDRPGYLWSEPGPAPRDAASNVRELHTLLAAAGETGPYLLVGHSLGGLHATLYAATWPDEIAGLVLVEAPTSEMMRSAEYQATVPSMLGFYQTMRFLAGSGLLRVLGPLGGSGAIPETVAGLPEAVHEPYLMPLMDPAFYATAIAEVKAIQSSADQVAAALEGEHPLGDMPVIVLTAGQVNTGSPMDSGRAPAPDSQISAQAALAQLSTAGEQRLVSESGHWMHLDAPEAIAAAIEELLLP